VTVLREVDATLKSDEKAVTEKDEDGKEVKRKTGRGEGKAEILLRFGQHLGNEWSVEAVERLRDEEEKSTTARPESESPSTSPDKPAESKSKSKLQPTPTTPPQYDASALPKLHATTPLPNSSIPGLQPPLPSSYKPITHPTTLHIPCNSSTPQTILQHFISLTHATPYTPTPDESSELESLQREAARAEGDRKHVATLLAEKRKEEMSLRVARGEVMQKKEAGGRMGKGRGRVVEA
jgi:hypothetical protein